MVVEIGVQIPATTLGFTHSHGIALLLLLLGLVFASLDLLTPLVVAHLG